MNHNATSFLDFFDSGSPPPLQQCRTVPFQDKRTWAPKKSAPVKRIYADVAPRKLTFDEAGVTEPVPLSKKTRRDILYKRFLFSGDCNMHPDYMRVDFNNVECKYCMCSTCKQELRYCGGCRGDIKPDDASCDYMTNPCLGECGCYVVNTFPDPKDCTECTDGYIDYEEESDDLGFTAVHFTAICACTCKRCGFGMRYCNGKYCTKKRRLY